MSEDLRKAKARARKLAHARRAAAHEQDAGGELSAAANARLLRFLHLQHGRPVAGYMPIRSEIDPRLAMVQLARHGPVGVPITEGAGKPLRFLGWKPGMAMKPGAFGVPVPVEEAPMIPEIVIVPMLAFDARGYRLGYGGGFYDRTLQLLRARGLVLAVGLAYAAQQAEALPLEPTDQPLDAVVTEREVMRFRRD